MNHNHEIMNQEATLKSTCGTSLGDINKHVDVVGLYLVLAPSNQLTLR